MISNRSVAGDGRSFPLTEGIVESSGEVESALVVHLTSESGDGTGQGLDVSVLVASDDAEGLDNDLCMVVGETSLDHVGLAKLGQTLNVELGFQVSA